MPNGGSWDRFRFAIVGFHAEFGRWPTRIRLKQPVMNSVLAHLSEADLAQVRARLELVVVDDMASSALSAEDGTGAVYEYKGPPAGGDRQAAQSWLGIRWN